MACGHPRPRCVAQITGRAGRSRRPKASKLDRHEGLRELERLKLTDEWSPGADRRVVAAQLSRWARLVDLPRGDLPAPVRLDLARADRGREVFEHERIAQAPGFDEQRQMEPLSFGLVELCPPSEAQNPCAPS